MRRWAYAAWAVLCGWAIGCAGTETGNPSFEGQLAYDAYSSDVTAVALSAGSQVDPPASATAVDSVWLVLGDISFTGDCEVAEQAPVHATGIGEGDHAAEGRVVTALALPAGQYCGVRVPLERAPEVPVAGPPELAGHSILIEGATPDGARFRLRSAMHGPIRLAGSSPFELSEGEGTVLIGFDLATWLGELDWSEAVRDGDRIAIDAESNTALLEQFEAAIAGGTALYRAAAGSPQSAPIDSAHPLALGR